MQYIVCLPTNFSFRDENTVHMRYLFQMNLWSQFALFFWVIRYPIELLCHRMLWNTKLSHPLKKKEPMLRQWCPALSLLSLIFKTALKHRVPSTASEPFDTKISHSAQKREYIPVVALPSPCIHSNPKLLTLVRIQYSPLYFLRYRDPRQHDERPADVHSETYELTDAPGLLRPRPWLTTLLMQ